MPSYHQYWCTLIIFIYPFLLLWEQLSGGNFWTWKYMTCWCRNPTIWYGWWIMTLGPYPTYPTYHMGMRWMTRWYFGVSYLSSILRRNYTLCFKLVLNLEDSQTSLENWWQKIYSTDQKYFCQGMVKRKGPFRCREGIYALCLFLTVKYCTKPDNIIAPQQNPPEIVQMGKHSSIFKEHWLIWFTVDVDIVLVHYVDASATMWMLVQPACGSFW